MATWLTTPSSEIWPDLTPAESTRVTRWIDQACRIIETRFTTIEQRIADNELSIELVGDVVEAMVTRALNNLRRGGMDKLSYPEVSMEWRDDGGAGTGSVLYLTLDELILLTPTASNGAFTIRRRPTPRAAS